MSGLFCVTLLETCAFCSSDWAGNLAKLARLPVSAAFRQEHTNIQRNMRVADQIIFLLQELHCIKTGKYSCKVLLFSCK